MDTKEVERYRQILTQIVKNSARLNGDHTDQPTISADVNDQAAANLSWYVTNVHEGILLSIRDAARRALVRQEEGQYGICIDCDEPIHPNRLEAVPWTDCCLACQSERENYLKKAACHTAPRLHAIRTRRTACSIAASSASTMRFAAHRPTPGSRSA